LLAFLEKKMDSRVVAKISRMVQHAIIANIAKSHGKTKTLHFYMFL